MLINNESFQKTVIQFMDASGLSKDISETLLNDFCEYSLKLVASIRNHILDNNLKEASILLHSLKGSAGNIRATKIAKQALVAEEAIKFPDKKLFESLLVRIEESLNALIEK